LSTYIISITIYLFFFTILLGYPISITKGAKRSLFLDKIEHCQTSENSASTTNNDDSLISEWYG